MIKQFCFVICTAVREGLLLSTTNYIIEVIYHLKHFPNNDSLSQSVGGIVIFPVMCLITTLSCIQITPRVAHRTSQPPSPYRAVLPNRGLQDRLQSQMWTWRLHLEHTPSASHWQLPPRRATEPGSFSPSACTSSTPRPPCCQQSTNRGSARSGLYLLVQGRWRGVRLLLLRRQLR